MGLEKSKIRAKINCMNKAFLLLAAFILVGCAKDYDNVVDISVTNFQVAGVGTTNSFYYNFSDSSITINIKFSSIEGVNSVGFDVYNPDNNKINDSRVSLFDNGEVSAYGDTVSGDNIYSNKFKMSQSYANGNYNIKYFVQLSDGTDKLVAQQIINYNNGQNNVAPVISDEVVNPDTVITTGSVSILTSVKAVDQNGQSDIKEIYFVVFKPDNTTNNTRIDMYDDGNVLINGDQTAGDGIYSRIIQVDQNNTKGKYTFKFRALDRGGKLSNEISKEIVIQ